MNIFYLLVSDLVLFTSVTSDYSIVDYIVILLSGGIKLLGFVISMIWRLKRCLLFRSLHTSCLFIEQQGIYVVNVLAVMQFWSENGPY